MLERDRMLRGESYNSRDEAAVESWASSDGARQIKVETQNINIPACRFYYRLGFRLRLINPHAYPSIPHETQMLWYKQIDVLNAFDDPLPR